MNTYDKFEKIETLIFDVDGVWTSGDLLVTEDGELLRTMNAKDGYAAKIAVDAGYNVIIISGGLSEGVRKRLTRLGISEVHIGVRDKIKLFDSLVSQQKIDPSTSLYVGDDIPDRDVMQRVLLPCAPNDAVHEILEISEYISPLNGGKGCVRDIIERVMRSQGKWQ